MIFFTEATETKLKASPRTPAEWVELGVEWELRKDEISQRNFAKEKGIPYGTFSKAMTRNRAAVEDAVENRFKNLRTRKERESKVIADFRASIKRKLPGVRSANNKTIEWYNDVIKNLRSHKVQKPIEGKIYAFAYDAKNKETLPYWDKYPLIIYLGTGKSKAGNTIMYGLNLHYIPPRARQLFLEELLKRHVNTKTITNKTRLKIRWSNVKGMRGSDQMIKAYLPGHLRSPMNEIKPHDWGSVVLLPLQQFTSSNKKRFPATKVWSKY